MPVPSAYIPSRSRGRAHPQPLYPSHDDENAKIPCHPCRPPSLMSIYVKAPTQCLWFFFLPPDARLPYSPKRLSCNGSDIPISDGRNVALCFPPRSPGGSKYTIIRTLRVDVRVLVYGMTLCRQRSIDSTCPWFACICICICIWREGCPGIAMPGCIAIGACIGTP